ncbi:MAG: malonyl CoA-ACP transacylase [Mycobacterium sp.]|nr:malonyl CoA-ACP transacylase [Mycobacterium sp.]
MRSSVAAAVGSDVVTVAEVDARERALRAGDSAHTLPRVGTSEARQLRRWITQVLVAERVVSTEARAIAYDGGHPAGPDPLPDGVARLEIGSVAASTLAGPAGRAVFARVTAAVTVSDVEVRDYHARNPFRFAARPATPDGWHGGPAGADLEEVRSEIAEHQLAAARRREYRRWLDSRCADVVVLADGYEHPGDPRQPDNTHRH